METFEMWWYTSLTGTSWTEKGIHALEIQWEKKQSENNAKMKIVRLGHNLIHVEIPVRVLEGRIWKKRVRGRIKTTFIRQACRNEFMLIYGR